MRWLLWATVAMAVGCQLPPADPTVQDAPAETKASTAVRLTALPFESDWTLESATVAGLDLPEARAITLHIAPTRVSGSTGCNQYSTGYYVQGEVLGIGLPAATKRGCEAPFAQIEQVLLTLLPQINAASMDGDALLLHVKDGGELRFVRAAPMP